jgi:aminopeptidase N
MNIKKSIGPTIRDRMVPRTTHNGAKLPSKSGDRYVVKRHQGKWSHIQASDLPKLVKNGAELAIWEDKPEKRHGKDGGIQDRELTRIKAGAEALLGDLDELGPQLDKQELGHSIEFRPSHPEASQSYNDIIKQIGNGGYDAQHYSVRIHPNFENETILGHTTMKARAGQNLDSFSLDFMPYPMVMVEVNGEAAKTLHKENELQIFPKKPIGQGEEFSVDVLYEGEPHEVKERYISNLPFGMRFVDGALSTISEPRATRGWLPCNDHPSDKATFDIEVTVPEGYEANASGMLASSRSVSNGQETELRFEPRDPMATYLVGLNAFKKDDYEVWNQESTSGVPIENSIPADSKPMARDTLNKSPEMVDFLESFLGDYPFEILGNHTFRKLFGGAFEAQTRNVYTHRMMELERPADTRRSLHWPTEVLAHETAHQWFGDAVSINRWRDIWVKEAFATYFGAAFAAHDFGVDLDEHMEERYEFSRNRVSGYVPGEPNAEKMYSGDAYNLMAGSVHALRKEVGEENFKKVLTTFLTDYNGKSAEVTDFVATAEETTGRDMKEFFNKWVYSDHLPKRLP